MIASEGGDLDPPSVTRVLDPEQVVGLTIDSKLKLGQLVSEALLKHPATMLQYPPHEVAGIMNEGRAIVAVGAEQQELHGFAQLSPWLDDRHKVQAVEFRTWLSLRSGAGLSVLRGAVALNRIKYPTAPLYTVIEDSNNRAQGLVMYAGALEVPMPSSMAIELKDGDQPARVRTFDLTGISPSV